MHVYNQDKKFLEKRFGFRDETGIKVQKQDGQTVGFMRHTCTLNISLYWKLVVLS